jgi:uncharacterized protein YrzB (UPF0473 family)
MKFKIIENGKEIECEIVLTFRDENNDINYIVYTDGTKDSDGELEVYASRYIEEANKYILHPIQSEVEWNLVDNMLELKFRSNK